MSSPAHSASPSPDAGRLPTRAIVDYSLPAFAEGFMFILVNIHLLKYTSDVLLISTGTMGLVFSLSRLWDAFADPVVGFLTDRTRSRLGRRRPWILASALPIGITFAMLWSPPAALTGRPLILWITGALFLFYTGIAMLETAHNALGAELTDAYHERTRVFGVRRILFGLGSLLSVGALIAFGRAEDARRFALVIGCAGGALAAASALWMVWRVRERPEFQGRGADNPWRAFRDVLRNPHARLLLLVFTIQQIGVVSLTTVMPFVSQYVLETPDWTYWYIGVLFVSAVLGVPVWVRIQPRGGKKGGLIGAMAVIGLGIFALGFAEPRQIWLVMLICVLTGFASAGTDVLFPSIQADVIDWDELQTGERKEGSYFAAWALASKCAGSLSVALVGAALTLVGYAPNAEQPPQVKQAILWLAAGGPATFYAVGILLFLRFRLGEAEHAEILAKLGRGGATAPPPV